MNIEPIHIDNHLIVVNKPAGLLVQGDHTGDQSLFEIVKDYLKVTFNKPGNVYLGLVHRLDRPVSGVIVFARTSKAASRLSDQFRKKTPRKTYWALVQGKPENQATLIDYIVRDGATSKIGSDKNGKQAELSYHTETHHDNLSLLKIQLKTGRHHQIRVQLAHRGFPIIGDFRYGSKVKFPNRSIALHAGAITINHPTTKDQLSFQTTPDAYWPVNINNILK